MEKKHVHGVFTAPFGMVTRIVVLLGMTCIGTVLGFQQGSRIGYMDGAIDTRLGMIENQGAIVEYYRVHIPAQHREYQRQTPLSDMTQSGGVTPEVQESSASVSLSGSWVQ